MMACSSRPVTGGVDTHKEFHVAAVVDHLGAVVATEAFANTTIGHRDLVAWLQAQGEVVQVGVEGTSSYGAGLSRYLREFGVTVVEVNRPDRAVRRAVGKSDTVDAVAAARVALAGRHAGIPKAGDGIVETIRILRTTRRSAIHARTQCANQIHTLIDTAPAELHDQHARMSLPALIARHTATPPDDLSGPAAATCWAWHTLARRWQFLDEQIHAHDQRLATLIGAAAPNLLAVFGVGPDTAGALLVAAGDNPDRLHSEAGFAALCGVNPLPASSGKTTRHRLNRGGNREANNALWRIALVRMRHDPTTRAYVERRTHDGLSKREIIRCLKRYIARQLYPVIVHDLRR
jgi:transposase